MTVDEAVDFVRTHFVLPLHPLCGGIPPEVAWPYLRRVVDEVLPRRRRLTTPETVQVVAASMRPSSTAVRNAS